MRGGGGGGQVMEGRVVGELDERGVQIARLKAGGRGGLKVVGVKLLKLRTTLHTLKLSPQNNSGEPHT